MYDSVPFINLEYLFYKAYLLLTGQVFVGSVYQKIVEMSAAFMPYATVLSLIFIAGILYCVTRTKVVESSMLEEADNSLFHVVEEKTNIRWSRVIKHLNSENESDWRLAVLEADLILEDMLQSMGYHGETIGDKLRGIERSDFNSLGEAWEAHRVRNLIAHEGGNFRITNREARRVVSLYEKVFKEFKFI